MSLILMREDSRQEREIRRLAFMNSKSSISLEDRIRKVGSCFQYQYLLLMQGRPVPQSKMLFLDGAALEILCDTHLFLWRVPHCPANVDLLQIHSQMPNSLQKVIEGQELQLLLS